MDVKLKILHSPLKDDKGIASCNLRSVILNGIYHIFEEFAPNGKWGIYKRISINGVNLSMRSKELFPLGAPGSFNENGNADPTVIYNGKWHLWFDAKNSKDVWDSIGYAVSDDSVKWDVKGPVLQRGDKYDSESVHHPVCMQVKDRYYMYYSGSEFKEYAVGTICLAASDDGVTWDKFPGNPVIDRGKRNEWDGIYVRPSLPVYIKDKYYMFYWGYNNVHSMGVATSTDLINWQKQGRIMEGTTKAGITGSHPVGNKIYFTTWGNRRAHIAKYERCN
jgi:predicted GH43/DUF377 family glycosyl hydrolase